MKILHLDDLSIETKIKFNKICTSTGIFSLR